MHTHTILSCKETDDTVACCLGLIEQLEPTNNTHMHRCVYGDTSAFQAPLGQFRTSPCILTRVVSSFQKYVVFYTFLCNFVKASVRS